MELLRGRDRRKPKGDWTELEAGSGKCMERCKGGEIEMSSSLRGCPSKRPTSLTYINVSVS